MASVLVFVAILVAVEISYRRWVRRAILRRAEASRAGAVIDLTAAAGAPGVDHMSRAGTVDGAPTDEDADVIALPARNPSPRERRRSG